MISVDSVKYTVKMKTVYAHWIFCWSKFFNFHAQNIVLILKLQVVEVKDLLPT